MILVSFANKEKSKFSSVYNFLENSMIIKLKKLVSFTECDDFYSTHFYINFYDVVLEYTLLLSSNKTKRSFNVLKSNNKEQKTNKYKILYEEFMMKMSIT